MRVQTVSMRGSMILFVAMAVMFAGCGSDDGGGGGAVNDEEIPIGSTQLGGGQLVTHFDFDHAIHLPFAACVGGSDEMCTGGSAIYLAPHPGFLPLEEDENGLFVVNLGVQLSIEITAIDAATSVRIGETMLAAPGESAVLGTTPEFHADGEWQIVVPGGEQNVERHISFVIKSDSPAYTSSQEYTATLEPGEEDHEHDE